MRSMALVGLPIITLLLSSISPQSMSGSSPCDVQLTIRTPDNRLSFQIGEIVPLELTFTSASRDKYQLDMARYDRSGRLSEDSLLSPARVGMIRSTYTITHIWGSWAVDCEARRS